MAEKEPRYLNRELSWLEFNQRVLEEAVDESVPLLERLFFLTITASNLDEFFMVRVGGLELLRTAGVTKRDAAGLSPKRQLAAIGRRIRRMVKDQYRCYADGLMPLMQAAGIRRCACGEVTGNRRAEMKTFFENELYPVISPMMLNVTAGKPLLKNLELCLAVAMQAAPENQDSRAYAAIPLGRALARLRMLPDDPQDAFVLVEDVVKAFAQDIFPGQRIVETTPFRITRNADVELNEEFAEDLAAEMQKVLARRKKSGCVRLELGAEASAEMEKFLTGFLDVRPDFVFRVPGPIDLAGLSPLAFLEDHHDLRSVPLAPQPTPQIEPNKSIFDQITRQDILLSHPFESFDPVVRFVNEAADDPDVPAIKQVLYRTSPRSPIIKALRRAARNGKYVTAVVELRARFDEERNIAWARELEESGVQVIYGIKNIKIHAKVCLVVRREAGAIVRYVHYGTGNYNDKTARLYTDVGLLTRDADLGADASAFFHAVTGRSEPVPYRKIEQSPWHMRARLLELIAAETARKRSGQKAAIMAKMNSLVDPEMIDGLYKASQAGVDIQLNVRGICCLRPGVKGLSERIRVVSIVDRFLEHSRIFCFHHGGMRHTFISSADWMVRNLSRRVELLVPVEDPVCKKRLIEILETCFADNVKTREMMPDGSCRRPERKSGTRMVRAQERLYQRACAASDRTKQIRQRVFEPHLSPVQGSNR